MNRKNNLKSAKIMFIFLAAMIMMVCTACQPTPENEAVQNKDDGQLEAAMMETATPETDATQSAEGTTQEPIEQPTQEVRVVDNTANSAGTINVNIDAAAVLPGDEEITVARLNYYNFEVAQMERIVNIFFGGNTTYYDHYSTTSSIIEENIIRLQHRLTLSDEELKKLYKDKNMTDISEIKAYINKVIDEHKQQISSYPEKAPVLEKFESDSEKRGFFADVDFGKDYMGYVSYDEPYVAGNTLFYCSAFKDEYSDCKRLSRTSFTTKFDVDTTSSEFEQAKQNAQNLVNEIGIDGVRLGDVYIAVGSVKNNDALITASGKEFYVFCFERVVGNRTIDYTLFDGGYIDEGQVAQTVPYEKIEVWTDGTEIVKFLWQTPHKVTEVVNENTAIQVDYIQALQLAINQIYAKYAYLIDNGRATNVTADITGIEFEMVRMKEKNTNNYVSVPAWKIYGEVKMKRSQEELDFLTNYAEENRGSSDYVEIDLSEWISETASDGPNIVTINALDGSTIDMDVGY